MGDIFGARKIYSQLSFGRYIGFHVAEEISV
jgi:hypothetical protein